MKNYSSQKEKNPKNLTFGVVRKKYSLQKKKKSKQFKIKLTFLNL